MKLLVTGSSGLIGGELVEYFDGLGWEVIGVDNNMRAEFFGPQGDTLWNLHRVAHKCKNFKHEGVDITNDEDPEFHVFKKHGPFDAVIHCAAQPSHDKAREIPDVDFRVNVVGTKNMLELTRRYCPNAVFIFMSTNKVYGDNPNLLTFEEYDTRYDLQTQSIAIEAGDAIWEDKIPFDWQGFTENNVSIDQGTHSIFGAHKLAADIMVQEYARTYGMKTGVFRGGCLTGPGHSGVELHGFLSYLVKQFVVENGKYTIYGYKGKQVRDNIHSYDVATAMHEFIKNPRPGEVYNIGGGRENSVSILEAIALLEKKTGKKIEVTYKDEPRLGDHICYITDMSKFRSHYPDWKITKSLDQTIDEMLMQMLWVSHSDDPQTYDYDLGVNSLVFDIGAYRGAWSEKIADKYDCRVCAFEPVKEFAQDMTYRFQNRNNVHIFNFALGAADGSRKLAKQGMNSSTIRGVDGDPLPTDQAFGEPSIETIAVFDIVQMVDDVGRDIDLVSLNCEGGEYEILNRLIKSGYITRFKNVQIQFHNFTSMAPMMRDEIREKLRETHEERFSYPWVWESWRRK